MGKQELKRKETAVVSPNGEGKQYEQTLTVDDTCLPSAEELTAYQAIDPNIVTFLMDVSKKEQEHRHKMERDKLRVVDKNERRVFRVNWWGMFFCFSFYCCVSRVKWLCTVSRQALVCRNIGSRNICVNRFHFR